MVAQYNSQWYTVVVMCVSEDEAQVNCMERVPNFKGHPF
jgi:hypothetical protein